MEASAAEWGRREREAQAGGSTRLPAATVAELRASSLLRAPVPRTHGGGGWGLPRSAMWLRGVARCAPATALAIAMHLSMAACSRALAATPAARPGAAQDAHASTASPPERRQGTPASGRTGGHHPEPAGAAWVAEACLQGRILGVANADVGPPQPAGAGAARTRASRDGGVWRLTGRKAFATWGRDADAFLCAATTPDGRVSFVVERDAPGVEVAAAWDGLGMRCSASVQVTLDEAPATAMVGYGGELAPTIARLWSMVLLGATFVGVGEGALAVAARRADGATASAAIGTTALRLEAAAGLLDSVAQAESRVRPRGLLVRAGRAKAFATLAAVEAATVGAVHGGGSSYCLESDASRFLRDALAGPHLRPQSTTVVDELARAWRTQGPPELFPEQADPPASAEAPGGLGKPRRRRPDRRHLPGTLAGNRF